MVIFLNGKFVPEKQAVVSIFDRGFLYGDGLFEAVRIFNGKPFQWSLHLERLQRGAEFLKIKLPFAEKSLRNSVTRLVAMNKMPDSILRLTLSRGVGVRGYSPKKATRPTFVMSLHPAPKMDFKNPPKWKLITSSFRVPANESLAQFKSCNKLLQVLARAEADAAGMDEALLLNSSGWMSEATSGNVFWIDRSEICTPPVTSGILPGVTRAAIFEICSKLKIPVREKNIRPIKLSRTNGIFLSLTSLGVVEAERLDGKILQRSPLTKQIAQAYHEMLIKS